MVVVEAAAKHSIYDGLLKHYISCTYLLTVVFFGSVSETLGAAKNLKLFLEYVFLAFTFGHRDPDPDLRSVPFMDGPPIIRVNWRREEQGGDRRKMLQVSFIVRYDLYGVLLYFF